MLQYNKNAALYCRLSRDDRNIGESDSIQNQELILTQYAKANGFSIVDIYKDDGYSGTTFDRPDFLRMIGDLRTKKADTVIVKDLSRFGREHIQADLYREIEFPQMRVRLIAINDNYDGAKADRSSNSMAQMQSLFNEWLAAETSEKVRRVVRAKAESGQHLGVAPYGYKKHADNKYLLVPDEEAAEVVRQIFDLAIAGYGYKKIARILSERKILTPTIYSGRRKCPANRTPYDWNYTTVHLILDNPVYLGHVAQGRTTTVSYKVRKRMNLSCDQWVRVEDMHEPIISQHVWDMAHTVLTGRKRPMKSGEPHLFAGMLFCADCDSSLSKNSAGNFSCQRYKILGKAKCTNHNIRFDHLSAAVLASLCEVSEQVRQDKDGFIDRLSGIGTDRCKRAASRAKKEHTAAIKRLEQLSGLVRTAFEHNAAGKLPDDLYAEMVEGYRQEREQLTTKMDELNVILAQAEQESKDTGEFVALVEKYIDMRDLDRTLLRELIKKIVVHQAQVLDGQRTQQIDIHYRFVGII